LRYRTIGGVVPPGATVMNVVPVDKVVRAEVRVATTDVGHVKVGQPVRVKVGTYDYLRYGTVDGKVAIVPAFSVMDEKNAPYFKVLVEIPQRHVGASATENVIEPGMTVQCDIITDRQTVLQYLLRPVYTAFRQGLRER
jgi:membrane fusion protein, adhesin transport system